MPDETIDLSSYTSAFFELLDNAPKKKDIEELTPLTVSQTASFFAIMYEKVRNSIEFREEHLVRRAAIERILTRRLSANPKGKGEGEILVQELLWARYIPNSTLSASDIPHFQNIIDRYIALYSRVTANSKTAHKLSSEYIMHFLTCEFEEELNPQQTYKKAAYLYFLYQVLKNKISIQGVSQEETDSYFYVSCEQAYSKNDTPYIRYHLFNLMYGQLYKLSGAQFEEVCSKFPDIITQIEKTIKNPHSEKLARFVKRQTPPFSVLYTIIDENPKNYKEIAKNQSSVIEKATEICTRKYADLAKKLKTAAIRSIIYIFLTKAVFALILEYPVSKLIYGAVHIFPIIVNSLFPPILMGLLVSFVRVPGEANTKKILNRIVQILNRDPSYETTKKVFATKVLVKRPILLIGFTGVYLFAFGLTFSIVYYFLRLLKFSEIGIIVFIFFVSLVAFFGYRVRQIGKELTLQDEEGVLSPILYFFFLPVLALGKWLSSGVAKLNFFMLIFDFIIEAPFKVIVDIIEEWIRFVRARKEEIM